MATVHLPRRHRHRQVMHDGGHESFQQIREGFWVLTLGVLVCFAFFLALGAFSLGDSATVTIVIAALAGIWIVHVWLSARGGTDRDPRLTHDRERRGF